VSPNEPRYRFGVVLALLGARTGAARVRRELARACEGLVASAVSPEQDTAAARCLEATGAPDEAFRRAERAVAGDARCVPCALTFADFAASRGDVKRAIVVLEHALSVSLDTPRDRALLEELARLRTTH
jgi:hypothetical protein